MMFGDIFSNLFGLVSAARAIQSETHRSAETERYIMEPYARGWRDWFEPMTGDVPARSGGYERVWLWRREWEMPVEADPWTLPPETNIDGLLWKPWRSSDPHHEESAGRLLTA